MIYGEVSSFKNAFDLCETRFEIKILYFLRFLESLWDEVFFVNAIPFVGFGFLDNFTMIVAVSDL